jgi:hypothetical protein
MWLLANCKNGISSYEIASDIGVDYSIPGNVAFWICGVKHSQTYLTVKTNYYAGNLPTAQWKMYVFTCRIPGSFSCLRAL